MPTAMMTRSAGSRVPSSSRTASTFFSPRMALVLALVMTLECRAPRPPSAGDGRPLDRAGAPSDVGARCRTVTSMPCSLRPAAASSPEQTAADDDGAAARLGREHHGLHVVEIAVAEHTRQRVAGHGNDDRQRARGDQVACRRARSCRAPT